MKRLFVFISCFLLIVSCSSEMRDKIPTIRPDVIELSETNPEAEFFVPENKEVYAFSVGVGKPYHIPKDVKVLEYSMDVSGKYKTTLYFKDSKLTAMKFPFLEIIRKKGGVYKIILKQGKPLRMSLGFLYSEGGSNLTIRIK